MKDSLYFIKDHAKVALGNEIRSQQAIRRQKNIVLFTVLLSAVLSSTLFAQHPKFFSPGRGDSCRVHPQHSNAPALQTFANTQAVVRLAYVIPSNRTAQPNAVSNFQHVIKTAQRWYKEQMEQNGFGARTFTVETEADGVTPKVHVVHVPQTDAELRGNGDGYDVWSNTMTATSDAGISLWAIGEVWVLIPEVHLMLPDGTVTGEVALGAGWGTSNRPGLTMISSKALALFEPSLITNDIPYDGQVIPAIGPYPMRPGTTFQWYEGNTLSEVVSAWTGALFHEMGHAFGLAHDFRNDNNFHGNLMGNGLRGIRGALFPDKYSQDYTRLEYTSALILNVNHFFNNGKKTETPSPVVVLPAQSSLPPQKGLVKIAFQASDNDSLSLAHLRYNGDAVAELVLKANAVDTAFAVPYFTPGASNGYTIAVHDKQGNTTYSNLQFDVPAGYDQAPFPFIRIDPPVPGLNQPVIFDASQSYDADSDFSSLLVTWDVNNDGEFDTEPTANKSFQYKYQFGDNYLVRVKVLDPTGAETISTPVSVKIPGEKKVAVESLTLINADNDKPLGELRSGMVINLAVSEANAFSIRANVSSAKIHRVKFDLKGPFKHQRMETKAPYTLYGETGTGDIMGRKLLIGTYHLTATPYTTSEKGAALSLYFKVTRELPSGPTLVWDKTIGGEQGDDISNTLPTPDGGYLLAGFSFSNAFGDKSENSRGYNDYWIVKLDSKRQKKWDRTFGGSEAEELRGIVPTDDGGYLLAGSSRSDVSGEKSENSRGLADYWIVKIDSLGNKIWDKTFGGMDFDWLLNVIKVPDGGFLLSGNSSSDMSGDKTENSKGSVDFWIVRIDDQGNKLWDRTFGGNGYDDFGGIALSPDGGFLLGGSSVSGISGDKSENSNGIYDDYWLVKIDHDGNKEWDQTIGGQDIDLLNNIIGTYEGGYLLTGSSRSDASVDKSDNCKGLWDFWVVKIDAIGNKIWDKTFGGFANDEASSALATLDGEYLLAGSSGSPMSEDKSENGRGVGNDLWIIKIDKSGTRIWDKTIGGTDHEWLADVTLTTQQHYLISAVSFSNASAEKSEDCRGGNDYWIVEVKPPTTLGIKSFTLMNAQTDREIRMLNDGDEINLLETHASLFNVRANATGNNISKVVFDLNGPLRISQSDKTSPYSLFGDHKGNYNGRKLMPGKYILAATPFSGDVKGTTLTISFTVTQGFEITGYTLIDANLNLSLSPLSDGGIISLDQLHGHKLSIQANTEPKHLDKVIFVLHGPIIYSNEEQAYPYTLFGETTDRKGLVRYAGLKLVPGSYTLEAIPYANAVRGASQVIAFTVIGDEPSENARFKVKVFPIPASGVINIVYEGKAEQANITMLNSYGKILVNRRLSQLPSEQLDVSMYEKGLYYLKVVTHEGVQVIRLTIE